MRDYNARRLFAGSCLTLVVSGLTFAIRGDIIGDLGVKFGLRYEQLGWMAGAAFSGFVFSIITAPALHDGLTYLAQTFPPCERVHDGVRAAEMYREALRPQFLVWVFCMLLTASTELGPNQWIPNILSKTANFPGILVLAWINGLMAIGRMLAGPVVHRLSPVGVLMAAAGFSAAGLLALSATSSAPGALAASTVFAIGVCYFWPTM